MLFTSGIKTNKQIKRKKRKGEKKKQKQSTKKEKYLYIDKVSWKSYQENEKTNHKPEVDAY